MSIDRFYTYKNDTWQSLSQAELSDAHTDYWVDLCHGGSVMVDERYYFSSLASALEFYADGWKAREFTDDDGRLCGLNHAGLYSSGRLLHGHSIYGDIPGREGERLGRTVEEIERSLEEDQEL